MHKSQYEIDEYLSLSRIEFRQILCIHLKDTGKEKVLEMLDNISAKDSAFIKTVYVSPTYEGTLD